MNKDKSAIKTASHTISLFKIYSILGATTLLAFIAGYLIDVGQFVAGVFVILAFIAFFSIQSILLRRPGQIIAVSILNALGFSIFLYSTSLNLTASLWIALFILFAISHFKGRYEVEQAVHIKFFKVVRPSITLLLIAITLYAGTILFINGKTLVEERSVARMVELVGKPIFGSLVENFSSETTLEEVMRGYAKDKLPNQIPGFNKLPAYQQEVAIRTFVSELSKSTENYLKYELKTNESLTKNVQSFIEFKTKDLSEQTQATRLALLLLILILAVKSVEFLIHIPLAFLGFIIYELLIAFGFIVVQFESRNKEVLTIS